MLFFLLFSRSKDIVEPLIKPQWWVRCGETAEKAVEVREVFPGVDSLSRELVAYMWACVRFRQFEMGRSS